MPDSTANFVVPKIALLVAHLGAIVGLKEPKNGSSYQVEEDQMSEEEVRSKVDKACQIAHRMQIVLSEFWVTWLDDLKKDLEANSYGEVVRRALIVLEEIRLQRVEVMQTKEERARERESGRAARVQVVLQPETLSRLKRLTPSTDGSSYSETIRQALSVLGQITRERKKGKKKLSDDALLTLSL